MLAFIGEHPTLTLIAAFFLVNLALGYRSQIDAWSERYWFIAAPIKILRGVFPDPWLALQGVNLALTRKLPEAIRSDLAKLPRPAADALREAISVRPPPENDAPPVVGEGKP